MVRTAYVWLAMTLCAAVLAGCMPDPAPLGSGSDTESKREIEPFPARPINPEAIPFDEFRLPESTYLSDYDTRFAVMVDSWANRGLSAIVLLDMDSGVYGTVLAEPVDAREGFAVLTARCSNTWVAWEELRGDEQGDPWNVRWKLYAAPILDGGPALGDAVLVAESITSIRSRPLFQVLGERLYWMTNTAPNPEQEGAVYGASIQERDLATSADRTVVSSDRTIHTFYVQADEVIFSARVSPEGVEERVTVVGLSDGVERFTHGLENGAAPISHWPTYFERTLVWAELDPPLADVPHLHVRTHEGNEYLLSDAGSDPCFVGSRLVYETQVANGPANVPWPTIEVLDVESGELYVLLETPGSATKPGFTMMPGQPRAESVLVVSDTVFGADGVPDSGTWIRRYRF
ncbi:MAG: hypothetical protein EG823_03160 [Actinobacteria bacterium]|nr:hypothetical protein [Actinomycetota bacterium]